MPEVSVVLATCDRPKLLVRALGSVLQQTDVDFEVILVDSNHDCDPVKDNPLVADLLADPRVVLVRPEPRPYSAATARNAGLALVRGEWVSYLDDDGPVAWRSPWPGPSRTGPRWCSAVTGFNGRDGGGFASAMRLGLRVMNCSPGPA